MTSDMTSPLSIIKLFLLAQDILCVLAAPVLRICDSDHNCYLMEATKIALLDDTRVARSIPAPSHVHPTPSLSEPRSILDILDLTHDTNFGGFNVADTDTDTSGTMGDTNIDTSDDTGTSEADNSDADEKDFAKPSTNKAGAAPIESADGSGDTKLFAPTLSTPLLNLPSLTSPMVFGVDDTAAVLDHAGGDDPDVEWLDDLCVCDATCDGPCKCDEEDYKVWTCYYTGSDGDGACVWELSS